MCTVRKRHCLSLPRYLGVPEERIYLQALYRGTVEACYCMHLYKAGNEQGKVHIHYCIIGSEGAFLDLKVAVVLTSFPSGE
jgi:hypothetical protein